METLSYRVTLRLAKLLNVILMTVPLIVCWVFYDTGGVQNELSASSAGLAAAIFVVLYITYGRIYESFLISLVRISEMVYSQCLALVVSDSVMYLILCLMARRVENVMPMFAVLAGQAVLSVIWCTAAHRWYFRKYPPKKTAIVYENDPCVEKLIHAYGLRKKFDIQATVAIDKCIQENYDTLESIETVFLCGVRSHQRNLVLKHCVERGIRVYIQPRIGDIIMSGAHRMHLFYLPFLRVGRYEPAPEYLFCKRILDVAVALSVLIMASPIMLITALAIKITDGGPVLYRQRRLTKDGQVFDMLKFRSMRQDAEADGVARLSAGDQDDRVTAVGRIIRRMRIDELPQMINILRGEMSVVGPRPERPEIAAEYAKALPEFSLRLQAKAGLTGYAQVYGKYNTTPYDKLQMDLMYLAHPGLWEDLRIMFATIKILLLPESTEGVAQGARTAMGQKEGSERIEV